MDETKKESTEITCKKDEIMSAKEYTKKFAHKIMVTNDFVKMMQTALPCAVRVLEQRKKDLETWGEAEKKTFEDIMGVSGDVEIVDIYYICDFENYTEKNMKKIDSYVPYEEEKTTVHEFMKKAVDRMHKIMTELVVDSTPVEVEIIDPCTKELGPVPDKKVRKYGNFVNRTFTREYSAYVGRTETWKYTPEQYKEHLVINIGYNFTKKKLMGVDSMASALCHEVSHFYRVERKKASENEKKESRGPWGGVGTDDLPSDQDYKHVTGTDGKNVYIEHREKLKAKKSLDVFKNAYNFELYFELNNNEC